MNGIDNDRTLGCIFAKTFVRFGTHYESECASLDDILISDVTFVIRLSIQKYFLDVYVFWTVARSFNGECFVSSYFHRCFFEEGAAEYKNTIGRIYLIETHG